MVIAGSDCVSTGERENWGTGERGNAGMGEQGNGGTGELGNAGVALEPVSRASAIVSFVLSIFATGTRNSELETRNFLRDAKLGTRNFPTVLLLEGVDEEPAARLSDLWARHLWAPNVRCESMQFACRVLGRRQLPL